MQDLGASINAGNPPASLKEAPAVDMTGKLKFKKKPED